MKQLFISFILIGAFHLLQAQTVKRCAFDEVLQERISKDPSYAKQVEEWNANIKQYLIETESALNKTSEFVTLKVPVVVHVIHQDGQENISDEQIHSQIDVLNEDYQMLSGTPGDQGGANARIEFCLASTDPAGNPTCGITRTFSQFTIHDISLFDSLRSLIHWNSGKYLNIYIVKSIGENMLGYTILGDISNPDYDGLVIQYKNFGRIGVLQSPYNKGRTCSHEVGHWLNLYHPFVGGCTGANPATCEEHGDLVCDTPPMINENYGCYEMGSMNTCADFPNERPDMIENYMGYANDLCMFRFTPGQVNRMRAYIFTNELRKTAFSYENNYDVGCCNVNIKQNEIEKKKCVSQIITSDLGLQIKFDVREIGEYQFYLTDITGRELAQKSYLCILYGEKWVQLPTTRHLSKGIFVLTLHYNGKKESNRFIVE